MKKSRTQYAVLGMLAMGPRSGYDIKREFEQRMRHFWAESVGQIYPTLHRLTEAGLTRLRVEQDEGRRDRKVYEITVAGRSHLREWLLEPPAPEQVRNELLLKLFFGPELGFEAGIEHIARHEAALSSYLEVLDRYEAEIEASAATPEQELFWKLTLKAGQRVMRARIDWCREARGALAAAEGRCGRRVAETVPMGSVGAV